MYAQRMRTELLAARMAVAPAGLDQLCSVESFSVVQGAGIDV
jgi:hypothetical protein